MQAPDRIWVEKPNLNYHLRQFSTAYRNIIYFAGFLAKTLKDATAPREVLDVCCGAGSDFIHLASALPNARWTGLDINQDLLEIGGQKLRELGMKSPVKLIQGDAYQVDQVFQPESFDVLLSLKTLSWMPCYEPLIPVFLRILKPGGVLFVSSLFTDAFVDSRIVIKEYEGGRFDVASSEHHYNVYCFEKFREYCIKCGASDVQHEDFNIDIDLEKPQSRLMGTYTRRTVDGARIQFSGPLHMPWRFVAITKRP